MLAIAISNNSAKKESRHLPDYYRVVGAACAVQHQTAKQGQDYNQP
jgi:hypothetical protein